MNTMLFCSVSDDSLTVLPSLFAVTIEEERSTASFGSGDLS